jgi:hypothetical protein
LRISIFPPDVYGGFFEASFAVNEEAFAIFLLCVIILLKEVDANVPGFYLVTSGISDVGRRQ